jgi:hypothetical protein
MELCFGGGAVGGWGARCLRQHYHRELRHNGDITSVSPCPFKTCSISVMCVAFGAGQYMLHNTSALAALVAIFLLALPVARCDDPRQPPLLTSLSLEPESVPVTMLDVPHSWPAGAASLGLALRLPGGFLKLSGVSRSGMSAVDDLAIDVFVSTCVARVKLSGDMLSSDDRTCFTDTETSFSKSDVLHHLSCRHDPSSPCACNLPFNRSISPAAADELEASGAVIERGRPYVLVSTVTVHGYLLDDSGRAVEIFSHVFDRLTTDWVPVQYVVFLNSQRHAETHAEWLRVVSSAQRPQANAMPAVLRVAHMFHGRSTSQELFYMDHLFSIAPVVDCPPGMRLRSIVGNHAACVLLDPDPAARACGSNKNLALWLSSDTPPAHLSFNGGKVHVFDCSLSSPALHQPLNFIPWCLRSVHSSLSTHFFPQSSFDSNYGILSSASWIQGTQASDAFDVTNAHQKFFKIHGFAGFRAILHASTARAVAHEAALGGNTSNLKGSCGTGDEQDSVVLMRLEVDKKNAAVLEELLTEGVASIGFIKQIIATFKLTLPYSSVLVDGHEDNEVVVAQRWPHKHAHCNECVQKNWLISRFSTQSTFDLGVERVGRILRSADQNYVTVAWRTLGHASLEVTLVLRSLYVHECSPAPASLNSGFLHFENASCSNSVNSRYQRHKSGPPCIEGGIDTCGLSFCSDAQAPMECIVWPKLLAFVKRVFDVCARRWWSSERNGKGQCAGMKRAISTGGGDGLQEDTLRDPDGKAWTFVLKVADNPSLLKLITYSIWHHVTHFFARGSAVV